MANTYLYKAQPGVGSSIKSTFSGWIKLAEDNLTGGIYGQYYTSSYLFDICLQNGILEVADYLGASGYVMRKRTTQKFRDLNSWYHIYVAIDRSLATAEDRTKIYINGERVTDFNSSEDFNYSQQTTGSHDGNCKMNNLSGSSDFSRVGIRYDGNEFNGSMSHIYWVDGSVIDIAQFGSTDNTTGEWKINTSPTIASFGQTGFLCLKDGNTITDQSPNSNNFTSSGAGVTKTEDNPSNVFCTINPLHNKNGGTFSNGNTRYDGLSGSPYDVASGGTLGFNSGKWYWEWKWGLTGSGNQAAFVGIIDSEIEMVQGGNPSKGVTYRPDAGSVRKDGSEVSSAYSGSGNDIFGMAFDMDAGTLKLHKNGTYFNSGNAVVTGIDLTKTYVPYIGPNGGTTISNIYMNFGNGYFGTTAVSSAGTNASGNGIFEYDVPTGYTALSTKGLNL